MNPNGTETFGEALKGLLGLLKPFCDVFVLISIAVQVLLAYGIAWTLHTLFKWDWAAYMWGGTAVALLLGWTRWVNMWFRVLRFNFAAAWELFFSRREQYDRNTPEGLHGLTNILPSNTLRVTFGPGLIGVNPFMVLARDKAIDVSKAQTLGTQGSDTFELITLDNVPFDVNWKLFVTAIKDVAGINCLIQHRDEFVDTYLTQLAKGYLESTARTLKLEQIFSGLFVDDTGQVKLAPGIANANQVTSTNLLEAGFSGFLGGKDAFHWIEKCLGRYTGSPMLTIRLKAALINALQSERIAKSTAGTIATYRANGVDADVAANLAAINQGLQPPVTATKLIVPDGVRDIHFVADSRGNRGGN